MRNYSIAAIPADGIAPEVISAGIEVLHQDPVISLTGSGSLLY